MASCGPPGLRERKKARTHEAIVDAALDLFERQGYEATTVEDIAAAADVSPRTFFRYFESKQDVVMAKMKSKGGGDDPAAALAERPPEEGPIEAMRQVIRTRLVDMVMQDDATLREMRVIMGSPELRAMALDHFHEHQSELAVGLADRLGVPHDSLEAHLVAGVVSTTLWAIIDRWVAEGADRERFLPIVEEAFDLLASGFRSGAPPSAVLPAATGTVSVAEPASLREAGVTD